MTTFITSRATSVFAVLIALTGLLIYDLGHSKPLNPYSAPAAIALGSDEAASGAFCALVPPKK
ncbi:hypothetical protein [Cohaesibacter celericrescens]|uniref:Uncharacterized protein n=1 Tax=Cohaesibacter celericrescens TaxID=2067669 RepID=A0A2N5XMS3_9HYPH|nr:hypothetical protein [Cohaesibacter celericrescens]PLW75782.1 hypothetical protein C0081_16860 [Cohaesibacter celericrescens]